MKVIEVGHKYQLEDYDNTADHSLPNNLFFMKRIGPHYPGNIGCPHHGTNCQEVLRVLIDRVKYLQSQIYCPENEEILRYLRYCILMFEQRAAKIHGRTLNAAEYPYKHNNIEDTPTCKTCGHIECQIKEHQHEI